jgi:hypothetical protein
MEQISFHIYEKIWSIWLQNFDYQSNELSISAMLHEI